MTVFCSKCLQDINESEFMIEGKRFTTWTIKDGNLICKYCFLKEDNQK